MNFKTPYSATDIIIEYSDGIKEGIILIERKNPPYGIAIPGGFAEVGITLEENAMKEAKEETNLEIEIENPGRPWVYSSPCRDLRKHVISNTYIAKGRGKLQAGDDAAGAKIYSIDEVRQLILEKRLAFDHGTILEEYFKHRGIKVKDLGKVGFIGRFKPLHIGAAATLEELCSRADEVIIGLGSSNRYNIRNPFTAQESKEMIDIFLRQRFSNYSFVEVLDFGHIPGYGDGQKWRAVVKELFGELDFFITGNDYVAKLLKEDYTIKAPEDYVSKDKQSKLNATQVRIEMVKGDEWKTLVPEVIIPYLEGKRLVERLRKEFGQQTLSTGNDAERDSETERRNIQDE